jgi:ERCC4-related helicase
VSNAELGAELHSLQRDFLETFFRSAGASALVAPTGSGKTRLLAEIVRRGFADHGYRRALIIAPSAVQEQLTATLSRLGLAVPAVRITKSRFRSIETGSAELPRAWDDSFVGLIGSYVLRQASVLARIEAQSWDLVAVDEAQVLDEQSQQAVSSMAATPGTQRFLVMTAMPGSLRRLTSLENANVTRWQVDHVLPQNPIRYYALKYSRSRQEAEFTRHLLAFVDEFALGERGAIARKTLLSAASSSLFAVQALLLLELHRISSGGLTPTTNYAPEGDDPQRPTGLTPWWRAGEATRVAMTGLIEEQDEIHEDLKFETLDAMFRSPVDRVQEQHVAILTSSEKTADYLRDTLRARGRLLIQSLDSDAQGNGNLPVGSWIAVLTDSQLRAADISSVDSVVHYDLPSTRFVMERRHGRTLGAARKRPITVYVVVDQTSVNPLESELLARYRRYIPVAGDQLPKRPSSAKSDATPGA